MVFHVNNRAGCMGVYKPIKRGVTMLLDNLDTFTRAYIEAALWSSCDDNDEPLNANYSITDIATITLEQIIVDCTKFQAENMDMIIEDLRRAGIDFWLTRNGHGAGFWDGDWPENGDTLTAKCKEYGMCDLYIGDDELIYC